MLSSRRRASLRDPCRIALVGSRSIGTHYLRAMARLNDAVQRAAGGGEGVDAARDFGVFDERRGVVGFEAGVDHERAAAAPMFVFCEGVDAVDVGGGVGAREGDPEEIAEGFGDELGVVDDDDQAEAGERMCGIADCGLRIAANWRYFGPSMARMPGRTTRGFLKPSASCRSLGSSVASRSAVGRRRR